MYASGFTEELAAGFATHPVRLPDDPYGVQVVTAGQDIDVVRVRRERAERIIGFLRNDLSGIIEDIAYFYWLVPAGSASGRLTELTDDDVETLGPRWSVAIPGSRHQGRRHWYGNYGTLADPDLLCAALAATRDAQSVRKHAREPYRPPRDRLDPPDAPRPRPRTPV